MHRIMTKLLMVLGMALAIPVTAANAQATRTWVSGVGDDANPCSRTAPCKTFAGAISKTAAGGLINALDPGGYGAVTITKSITIAADRQTAKIIVAGTNAIIINAGVNDRVVLDGIDIDSAISVPGLNGIRVLNASEVLINNCAIRNFISGGVNGAAILIDSNSKVRVTVTNSILNNNLYGVRIPTKTTNQSHLKMFNTLVINNTTAGISVDGAGNDALVSDSKFFGPKSLEILNGAQVISYGNNILTTGDAPTSTLPLR